MPLVATSIVSVVKLSQKLPGESMAPFKSVHPTPCKGSLCFVVAVSADVWPTAGSIAMLVNTPGEEGHVGPLRKDAPTVFSRSLR